MNLNAIKRSVRRFVARLGVDIALKPSVLLQHEGHELNVTMALLAPHVSKRCDRPFFVQVGANDGALTEPFLPIALREGWQGVLVEPQTAAFERLKSSVGNRAGVQCRRVALDRVNGSRTLYRVRADSDTPDWADGLASFDRNHLLKFKKQIPGVGSMIEEETVHCVTFDTLLQDIGQPRLDVLQVDTEGYDLEILKMADLARHRPLIVNFEHVHLSHREWNEAVSLLLGLGYLVTKTGSDTLAYLAGEREAGVY